MRLNLNTILFSLLLLLINFPLQAQLPRPNEAEEEYVQVINTHFRNGKWEEGKVVLDRGIARFPKDSDLRMLLGKYYYEKKNYDLARYELLKALDYDKHNVNAKQLLVNVEIESGRYSSAICYINELLEVNPYAKGLWLKKTEAYRLQGNIMEANRMLARLYQIYPNDEQIRSAYIYNMEQDVAEKKAGGQVDEAIDISAALVEISPQNEELYFELINNCLRAGYYDKALTYAERGIYNIPSSMALINKKVDILADRKRYNEALEFLQVQIRSADDSAPLQRRYQVILEESAQHYRRQDPYVLYKNIYDRNPRHKEAFNYVYGNALSRGYYEDAIGVVKKARQEYGDTKELLLKEMAIYKSMGALSKADQITAELYGEYPEDPDIKYTYTIYRLQQGRAYMQEGLYRTALGHWLFVYDNGEPGEQKVALESIYACYLQTGELVKALETLETLAAEYPGELEWRARKADVYMELELYKEALDEYGQVVILSPASEKERALRGYDEAAILSVKKLIDSYRIQEAAGMVEQWLEVTPRSEAGLGYAMNLSMRMRDYEGVKNYSSVITDSGIDNIPHRIKLAQAHHILKEYEEALDLLDPLIEAYPYHQELIDSYSQLCQDYSIKLLREGEYDKSIGILDSALLYDPDNRELKYWKGNVYEKLHDYDSAYYYQSFYEPGLMELRPFRQHMKAIKFRTYRNEVGFSYLYSRFSDRDIVSYIATTEYTRFAENNHFAGRINYTGKQLGKGLQGQFEWTHIWKEKAYIQLNAAAANKFFPYFIGNGSFYKTFKKYWEWELGGGYRRLVQKQNMFNIRIGISRDLDLWWLNARFNSVITDGSYYYSLLGQGRFYYNEYGSYITAMASFGSAPDIDVIDNHLYNAFSVTNSMIGLGVRHLLSDRITVGLLGNRYNYKDRSYISDEEGKYRNVYNLYLQVHVRF